MTRVKVAKWGNSLGLRLPRALVNEVGLEEGQIVRFDLKEGPKGLFAENVSKIED